MQIHSDLCQEFLLRLYSAAFGFILSEYVSELWWQITQVTTRRMQKQSLALDSFLCKGQAYMQALILF